MNRTKFIQEYLDRGFSLIPLKNNSKVPAIRWKKYQYKRAGLEEILNWFVIFKEPNIAILTGNKLVVIDLDDIEKMPELLKILPGIDKTTRVKTKRPGLHFYFSNNEHKISSTKNLFGLGIELKAGGNYVVAPPSKIDNFTYNFEVPLSKIKPLPGKIINELLLPGIVIKEGGQASGGVKYKKVRALPLPRYNGLNRYCMKQILGRELKTGERDNSLFILYNLLLQNKNRSDHAKKITIIKNNSSARPLTDQELKKVFKKRYKLKCSKVRETLPFIECDKCRFKFKGGRLGMGNVIVKNIMKLPELEPSEQRVLLFLGTVFEGENPSTNKIAEITKMDFRTVDKAVKGLRKKGIIE